MHTDGSGSLKRPAAPNPLDVDSPFCCTALAFRTDGAASLNRPAAPNPLSTDLDMDSPFKNLADATVQDVEKYEDAPIGYRFLKGSYFPHLKGHIVSDSVDSASDYAKRIFYKDGCMVEDPYIPGSSHSGSEESDVEGEPAPKIAKTGTLPDDKLQEGLCIVKEWSFFKNAVAKALVKVALHTPECFTRVEEWQDKLYTALTNTVWVQGTTKRYAIFTTRKASGVVAFLDSVTGGQPCKGYMDGPYCGGASLGDEVDFENDMHRLMRALDFYTIPFPKGAYNVKKFHEEYTDGTGAEPLYTSGPRDDYVPENFWFDAAHLWCHKGQKTAM